MRRPLFALSGAALLIAAAPIPPDALPPMTIIPAPAQPSAIKLGTGLATGVISPELWFSSGPERSVRNVHEATLTPILPDPAKATGAAVVIAPGGGFLVLSMDREGWSVAHWFADHGIAAFVLKYRLRPTPPDQEGFRRMLGEIIARPPLKPGDGNPTPPTDEAVQDGVAAIRLVRSRAAEWHVDPRRVGMVGFSAGAVTTLQVALHSEADDTPNFAAAIYPAMGPLPVSHSAPPLFIALAMDDRLFGSMGYGLAQSWRAAGRPFELHVYQAGDHGFGLGRAGTTTTDWPESFRHWLSTNGLLERRP